MHHFLSIYYTNMDFWGGEYDVICTEKINIDRGDMMWYVLKKLILTEAIAEVKLNFSVHITSYSPPKKYISVLLYDL
jgi:hypothetical protein